MTMHKNFERTNRLQLLRTEHQLTNVLHAINFEKLANYLQSAQYQLEQEYRIKEASDISSAMARGGYLDDAQTQNTLGSAIRDYAMAQVKS